MIALKPADPRAWILAALLGVTAVVATTLKPHPSPEAEARARVPLEQIFPAQFGDWRPDPVASGLVRPAFDVARRFQMYDQVLERIYMDSEGHRIMLSAAYGRLQSVGLQMHRPEVCYKAGGFFVDGLNHAVVELAPSRRLPVTRLTADMPGRHEPVTYWRVMGHEVAEDDAQFRWHQLRLGMQQALPDGMLVRVSSIDDDDRQAWALQARFIAQMVAALGPDARDRVLGQP